MIKEHTYLKPTTVAQAIEFAEANKSFKFLAGGTDVMVNKFQGNDESQCLIDLGCIEELKLIKTDNNYLKIGSLVRLDDLQNSKQIVEEFPVLIEAAKSIATPVIRKTATVGGNILCENRCIFFNQSSWWREAVGYCLKCEGQICIATGGAKACFSKFVSDLAPALISMNAIVEIVSISNKREVLLEEIYTGDGVNSKKLQSNEIVVAISLPLQQQFKSSFKKLRKRESVDFSSLTSCVSINNKNEIKISLAGIDPKPVVVQGLLTDDAEDLIKQAIKKSRIVDNDVFSRVYRRKMIQVYLSQSLAELMKSES